MPVGCIAVVVRVVHMVRVVHSVTCSGSARLQAAELLQSHRHALLHPAVRFHPNAIRILVPPADVQQAFMDAVGGGAHMLVGLDVSDAGVADFLQVGLVVL